ncbi:DinB family protein [Bailinhaonella thermotolerans]|uniref:DinB family protein n=1 Tax=Bailinhaonella thermotolerans TaxID=1070861 RepID=A0A3A4BC26_9ACTN|nr:DinB family protein [Bailinhaonella thermotolerans]RJL36073.1 DinB family protein [Bailinhaonella thermotolerans]
MINPRVALLTGQLDIAMALLEYHLKDLDDEAALWEPAAHCWTVRRDERGRWVADFQDTEPDPAPAVTIAWVTWHIGFWWTTTMGHCFGGGAPAREEITWPGTAGAAADWLRDLHRRWREHLETLTDADLDSTERTAGLWGQEMTLGSVAGWVNVELTKNVAELGLLRNLRGARAGRPLG